MCNQTSPGSGHLDQVKMLVHGLQEELVAGKHMRSPTVDGALAKKAAAKARKIAKRRQNPLAAFRCFVSPGACDPGNFGHQGHECALGYCCALTSLHAFCASRA